MPSAATSILLDALTSIATSYPKTDEGGVLAEIARDALADYATKLTPEAINPQEQTS